MIKNIKNFNTLFILLLFCTAFVTPNKAQASSARINSVNPQEISLGQDIVIQGNNFGSKKGNIYIGGQKYPYYGHSISFWSDSKIIINTNDNTQFFSGNIGIQRWKSNSYGLDEIIYGEKIIVKPSIKNVSRSNTSSGTTLNILGTSFKSFGNNAPQVFVGNQSAQVDFWSDNNISASLPKDVDSGYLKIKFGDNTNNISIKSDYVSGNSSTEQVQLIDQWYLESINAYRAKETQKGSGSIVVAVIDDGIYLNHPDLKNNIWNNSQEIANNNIDDDKNGFVDDKWGWNFVDNSNNMTAKGTHGTMVAGIIGSQGGQSGLTAGINYNVSLMPIIISDVNAYVNANNINNAIYYAVDNGADIINLSLGGLPHNFSEGFDKSIKYAYDNNVLVVAAAGNGDTSYNSGLSLDEVKISPVCNDGDDNMVLGVAASNENNRRANWSNYGSCVDIYAPGVDITSTANPNYNNTKLHRTSSGTSFSTPIISGTAALIKAKYPEISNKALLSRIVNNSKDFGDIKVVDVHQSLQPNLSSAEKYSGSQKINRVAGNKIEDNDFENYIIEQRELLATIDHGLADRLSGRILLQVEDNGEAWYVFPENNKRYYLGTAGQAYELMKKLSLGAKHDYIQNTNIFPERLLGKILIDVEQNGEAYYINPIDRKAYYMKDGQAAYNIMREHGLGISNQDIRKISIGQI